MKQSAPFLILTAGILWGLIGVFIRRLNGMGFGSMEIAAVRAVSTALLTLAFLSVYDRRLLKIRLRDLWCFLGTGIFSIVFFNYCYFQAISLTSLSAAAVLLYTAPAFVMVLSAILFRERITGIKILSLIVTFAGCVLVTGLVGAAQSLSPQGILVGLGAGFGYALYSIFSRFALERGYHAFTISFYTFLFAIAGTVPLADWSILRTAVTGGVGTAGFCLLFGLFSTVIPYIVYTLGLKETENGRASILASVEPVTATVLGVAVYREPMSFSQLCGVLLVLGAIVLCSLEKKPE